MNKGKIMYYLQEESIMREIHESLVASLTHAIYQEYLGQFTEITTKDLSLQPPIFRAVVQMLISQMMNHCSETIIEKVVEIVAKCEKSE